MAKQRQVRIEQGLPQSLMEEMQERSDEQLESESKHRSIALAILGSRAAERYDAATARTYFQRAIAASRPQERVQIRRMADASLALAERRADDLKHAVEKLGGEAPSGRALMGLRLMGLIVPPPGAGPLLKARGFGIVALIVIVLLALGLGVVELFGTLFFGGVGLAPGLLLGLIVDGVGLAVLAFFGRRRQKAAGIGGSRPAAGVGKGGPSPGRGAAPAKAPGPRASAGKGASAAGPKAGGTRTSSGGRGSGGGGGGGGGGGKANGAGPSGARRGGGPARGGGAGTTAKAPAAKPGKGPAKKGSTPRPKRPAR